MSTRQPVFRTRPAMAGVDPQPFLGRFLTLLVLLVQYLMGLFFDGAVIRRGN